MNRLNSFSISSALDGSMEELTNCSLNSFFRNYVDKIDVCQNAWPRNYRTRSRNGSRLWHILIGLYKVTMWHNGKNVLRPSFNSRSTKKQSANVFPVKKITSQPEKEEESNIVDHTERPLDRQMLLEYSSSTAMLSLYYFITRQS